MTKLSGFSARNGPVMDHDDNVIQFPQMPHQLLQLPESFRNGPWWYVIPQGQKHPTVKWSKVDGEPLDIAFAKAQKTGGRLCSKMDPSHNIYVIDLDPEEPDGKGGRRMRPPAALKMQQAILDAAIGVTYCEQSSSGKGWHIVGRLPDNHSWCSKRNGPRGSGIEFFTGKGIVVWTFDAKAADYDGNVIYQLEELEDEDRVNFERIFPTEDDEYLDIELEPSKAAMEAKTVRARMIKGKRGGEYKSYLYGPAIVGVKTEPSEIRWDLLQWAATITIGCHDQIETLWEILEGSWLARTYTVTTSKSNKDRFANPRKIHYMRSKEIPKVIRKVMAEDLASKAVGGKIFKARSNDADESQPPAPPVGKAKTNPPPPPDVPTRGELQAPEPKPAAGTRSLNMVRVSDVAQRQLEWLWPDRIANGKVSLIAGHGGIGKSQLTAYLAGVVTKGGQWPNDDGIADNGSVLMLSSEDDIDTTIGPRLTASGADISKVFVVKSIKIQDSKDAAAFSIADDMQLLRDAAMQIGDLKLITIDPVTAYLLGTDTHRTADVRSSLLPIQALAEELNIPIVLVSHFNKASGSGAAANAVTGSGAFVHVARATFAVSPDPDDPENILFMQVKNNLGNAEALSFTIEAGEGEDGVKTSKIVFNEGTDERTADEVLNAHARESDGKPSANKRKASDCEGHIYELLRIGPKSANSCMDALKEQGFTKYMIDKCCREMRVKKEKDGAGEGAQWWWSIDNPDSIVYGSYKDKSSEGSS